MAENKYPGILIGKHPTKNIFLCTYGQTFVILAAPPGSGKGVSFIVPNLLQFPHSAAVNDPKFENWQLTSGFRTSCGQKCYRFSPELLETHRWNPLNAISRDELDRLSDITTLNATLFVAPDPAHQGFYDTAADFSSAIMLYMMETPELPFTLPQVYEIACLGNDLPQFITDTIEARDNADRALSAEAIREMMKIVSAAGDPKSWSIHINILNQALKLYGEKKVAYALSGDDIDFSKMRSEKISVYFSVTDKAAPKFGPLMNLFFSQLIGENSTVLPEHGGVDENGELILKYQIAMFMDEMRVVGRIKKMETAPALLRGYGFRFALVMQSKAQMREKVMYGKEGGDAIMNALHCEVVFAPAKQDTATAAEYSKALGNKTVSITTHSKNRGEKQKSHGQNQNYQARPLMLPQEIQDMPYEEELIFVTGSNNNKPLNIKARKIFYYKEDVFKSRVNIPPPPIPVATREMLNNIVVPMRKNEMLVGADYDSEEAEQISSELNKRNK